MATIYSLPKINKTSNGKIVGETLIVTGKQKQYIERGTHAGIL